MRCAYHDLGASTDGRAASMTTTLFKNCTILDATRAEPRPGSAVLVEDGEIREVADRAFKMAADRIVDVGGRTLMPGLIDAHVHAFAIEANLANLPNVPMTIVTLEARDLLEAMLRRG